MHDLDVQDLHAFVQAATATPLLLDVREPWEFALASITLDGAADTVNLPLQSLPQRLAELPKDRAIVCICHHGMRSAQAAGYLRQAGFQAVHNLRGGIDAWSLQVDPGVPRY
jgi:rhodanese-related sulfurtransferase